jgi:hypothetical protein
LSIAQLNGPEHFSDESRRLHRDLPHLIAKAMSALRGHEQFAPDLKHELECVEEDVFEMFTWAKHAANELQKLFVDSSTDAEAYLQYGETLEKTMRLAETHRQAVQESCNRADMLANRICSAALNLLKTKQIEGPAAPHDEGRAKVAQGDEQTIEKRSQRRGRKPDPSIDPKADKRIADAWTTGAYRKYADLARELGIEQREVSLAIERHRHRESRRCR